MTLRDPLTNWVSCFLGFISQYAGSLATLVAGLGGAGLVTWNERRGCEDIKKDLKEKIDSASAKLENELERKVHAENQFTQILILRCAVKTMKALDGDKEPMRAFVKDAEKLLHCVELGEDC